MFVVSAAGGVWGAAVTVSTGFVVVVASLARGFFATVAGAVGGATGSSVVAVAAAAAGFGA